MKQKLDVGFDVNLYQPPSGGCVLKLKRIAVAFCDGYPAAFGRLCVETSMIAWFLPSPFPAAFGRLCVETLMPAKAALKVSPAAFGRLCV